MEYPSCRFVETTDFCHGILDGVHFTFVFESICHCTREADHEEWIVDWIRSYELFSKFRSCFSGSNIEESFDALGLLEHLYRRIIYTDLINSHKDFEGFSHFRVHTTYLLVEYCSLSSYQGKVVTLIKLLVEGLCIVHKDASFNCCYLTSDSNFVLFKEFINFIMRDTLTNL